MTVEISAAGLRTVLQPIVHLGLAEVAEVALDDRGTGYSGLREIATLQPDVVKLDRSFVITATPTP